VTGLALGPVALPAPEVLGGAVLREHADRENYRSLAAPSPRQPGGAQQLAGTAEVVNAGHVPLLLVRAGKVSDSTRGPTRHSAGCPAPLTYCKAKLEPGDRLVLLTDGMLERNASQAASPTC
jgi:hypothetical protein